MDDNQSLEESEGTELKSLAIEGKLPLKAVGIENLKESNPQYLPPHRYLHPWFARRPTPASRLAILASVLPQGIEADKLLEWMQFAPKRNVDESISSYIERKKATEDEREGTLEEHYGYPRPFTRSPTPSQIEEFHNSLRNHWEGELPAVLDPTAGGGVIPYESLRYGLPTYANELNPVPSIILKVMLEYAPDVGDISHDVRKWGEKVDKKAGSKLQDYFPNPEGTDEISNYIYTYTIECRSCGADIPLVPKWRIRSKANGNLVVVRPEVTEDKSIAYDIIISPTDDELDGFDPNDGPVSRGGDAECLNCQVVTEGDEIKDRFNNSNFAYEIFCVRTINSSDQYSLRAPTEKDKEALESAIDYVDSNYNLSTFLNTPIPDGSKTSEPRDYGLEMWRDLFSPRQLISNYAYVESIQDVSSEIKSEYDQQTANAILTILSLPISKLIDRNSRLTPWDSRQGYPSQMFKSQNFSFKRIFVDSNLSVGGISYEAYLDKIHSSYQEIVSYLPKSSDSAELSVGDAASLPMEDNQIEAVVVDPPYYSSIMYSELSDVFYVWLRECLGGIFPELFAQELTDKTNEAVANSDRFDSVANKENSKSDLANEFYEDKMSDIFSELYRVLSPGGVMTVMFTHKETDAWDTLTMSLINSGFTITSTHPITSEMPQRAGMQKSASADSTLLLTGRKPHSKSNPESAVPSLWSDVKSDTRKAAQEAARELIDSGLSLTKTDVIISAFGPTLRVFADAYPVVDDEDNEVQPRRALEEAREAVTQVLVDEYLDAEGIEDLDDISEWYILSWLVHESQTFSYDEGHQLGLGIGVNIDEIKRSTKTWRKSRGDIKLRGHGNRVQNINEKPENRSSRTPVNPDELSFGLALDKVHAAMHVYNVQGESACCDWLRERNFDSDSTFKATLKALLQVLPHDHEDWKLARDLAVGRTRDVLDLDFSPNVFADDGDETTQSELTDH